MTFVLWLIAVILVIAGIVALFRGAVAAGIVLIVVGLLIGPGGVSVFTWEAAEIQLGDLEMILVQVSPHGHRHRFEPRHE